MTYRSTSWRFSVWAALALVAFFLAGCVTTTDSRFSREADRQEAIADYVQLATAYIGQGNMDRARHHLDRALDLDSDNAGALAAMGHRRPLRAAAAAPTGRGGVLQWHKATKVGFIRGIFTRSN